MNSKIKHILAVACPVVAALGIIAGILCIPNSHEREQLKIKMVAGAERQKMEQERIAKEHEDCQAKLESDRQNKARLEREKEDNRLGARRREKEDIASHFSETKDSITGVTYIEPLDATILETGCYLYIGQKDNGQHYLFLRCVRVGDAGETHFDEVLFRINGVVHKIKNDHFESIRHGKARKGAYFAYYDFIVGLQECDAVYDALNEQDKARMNLESPRLTFSLCQYLTNRAAVKALSAENGIKFRFQSSVHHDYEDIYLSIEQLRCLRLTYKYWEMLTEPSTK